MKRIDIRTNRRRGVSAVEFAVVLPLIVLLLVGSIEAARGLMVSHSLQEAAQAGCRVYSVEGTTQAQATALIDLAMSNAGVTGYSITYDPAAKAAVDTHMEPVEVTITVPFANVAWLPPSFLSGATLQGNCVMPADMDISDGGDQNGYSDVNDDNEFDGIIRVDDTKDDD
jgi:hypothetical protein